jgi:hypothetical protein
MGVMHNMTCSTSVKRLSIGDLFIEYKFKVGGFMEFVMQ